MVVFLGWSIAYFLLFDSHFVAALQMLCAAVLVWVLLPAALSTGAQREPLSIVSVLTSCVAVLWAPHILLEWHRGQLVLGRGFPNFVFAAFIVVYYLVYRDRDHEHMISGLFMTDKYGVVLMFALLKVYKHAEVYLSNASVLRIHVAQMISVTLTFTFSTSRANAVGIYNTAQALLHQVATGIYAVITCLELLVR